MKKLYIQIINFLIVGFLSFFIDYFIMIFLTEKIDLYYLISSTISFSISLVFNYVFSMKFVFKSKHKKDKKFEFIIFVLLSIIGLIVNQLSMWVFVEKLNYIYKLSKVFSTAIVMIWNFITKKLLLESKNQH